jgi:hypothetical protein
MKTWMWAMAAAICAASPAAQPSSILGTVTEFRVERMQLAVKVDGRNTQLFPIGPDTEVVRVPPGETTLEHATPSRLADIAIGDRVLASFVDGLTEARRIVVVSLGDIARRNEAERADWQKRGVAGEVTAVNGAEITLALRSAQVGKTLTVAVSTKTKVRRYAEGSVKFTAAVPSAIQEIAVGDQAQARGEKSADGTSMTADDLVFGAFLTKLGTVTAIDAEEHSLQISEAANGKVWRVRLSAESQMKKLPDMRSMIALAMSGGKPANHDAAGPPAAMKNFDITQMLTSLPAARMEDLKIGGGVALTSTAAKNGELTVIMLLTNADLLVEMSKPASAQQANSGMAAFVRMHGGMLGSGANLSLPAIIP